MCGILGIATVRGRTPSLDDHEVIRLRDTMVHRGPDDAGLWRGENVLLAHRRLAVIDPTPAGHQPMTDGRFTLVYNGELYNNDELRRELGCPFRSDCDTETVLLALARWGPAALARLRGMFALALYDSAEHRLLLARDPLGIKPLYYWIGDTPSGRELVFASDVNAILSHPAVPVRPDYATISSYLTTIRLVLGERTLFAGVRSLTPGQTLTIDLAGPEIEIERGTIPRPTPPSFSPELGDESVGAVREAVVDSVTKHLRADVPTCCLLSGGLDSSIVAATARRVHPGLNTYCSGAESDDDGDDFAHARLVAAHLGTRHAEAPITRDLFARRWREMVCAMGLPLGTPNEVAINEVARCLRADGQVVTISGEGADELFAGYEMPMVQAAGFVAEGVGSPGVFQIDAHAWVPRGAKSAVLNEAAWTDAEGDGRLVAFYEAEFARIASACDDPLACHLRFHQRVNLAGLLARLDTATMLESVEGRTPFADAHVAALARVLPMSALFTRDGEVVETKRVLRRAFAGDLPPEVVARPKASFPLPFQQWVADQIDVLHGSSFARALFTPPAIAMVCADPTRHWHLAWPMVNLALWGEHWWG